MLHWGKNNQVLVLCYHNIGDPRKTKHRETNALTVPPIQFERQIKLLSKILDFITPVEFTAALEGGPLPPRPALLTFDDGTKGLHDYALHTLSKHHVKSLCFVAIHHHLASNPYWWDIADQREAKNSAGSFSETLERLKYSPDTYIEPKQIETGIIPEFLLPMSLTELNTWTAAGQFVASHANIHRPCSMWHLPEDIDPSLLKVHFKDSYSPLIAYPYGDLPRSNEEKENIHLELKKAGFRGTFGTHTALANLPTASTPPLLAMPRMIVPNFWSNPRLLLRIASLAILPTNNA